MKKIYISCLVACSVALGSCKKFLDVNTNPNAPSTVASNVYLAPMIHWMVTDAAYEGRHIGRYTQNWALPATALSTWDRMGYDAASDNGSQTYRDVYWVFGQNLIDMMNKAEAEQRWDILGVGYILKGWGWQTLTGIHGEITIKEAFMPDKTTFAFDTQQFAYEESRRLINLGIQNLQRTDGFVSSTNMAIGDKVYNGDRSKWIKYAYGLLAMNLNHYSNKGSYDPVAVIDAVDKSFASNADDLLLTYGNTGNDDSNFMGPRRQNFQNYRQTEFVVRLMNGTQFGGVVDPRMSRMLVTNPAGTYTGVNINNTYNAAAVAATTYPNNIWNYQANISGGAATMYLFHDKSRYPGMTYSQLQFIKAEAAYKRGDKITALAAYKKAIESHIDFVNARNTDNVQLATQISATEKAAFLANPLVVPTDPNNLNLSMIMCQKYIAQWGWGHYETWMDLRRYNYTGVEPGTTRQVFLGFALPTSLFGDNNAKAVQRIRPRYNSEYVWNRAELDKIGGLATDYHTVPMWITQP